MSAPADLIAQGKIRSKGSLPWLLADALEQSERQRGNALFALSTARQDAERFHALEQAVHEHLNDAADRGREYSATEMAIVAALSARAALADSAAAPPETP